MSRESCSFGVERAECSSLYSRSPEIGRQRSLSTSTVKTYLHQLYEKLGVSDRAAAVAEGMRRGLIE